MDNKKNETKIFIIGSFKDLLMNHSFEKITIKMITEHADVARPTFYNYFKDKHEILESILEDELTGTTMALVENDMMQAALEMIFSYFSKNRAFYKIAFHIKGQNSFESILTDQFTDLFRQYIEKNNLLENSPVPFLTRRNLSVYFSKQLFIIVEALITKDEYSEISDEEIYQAALYLGAHSLQDILKLN